MPPKTTFGGRMTHDVPIWVHPDDHQFHILIRQDCNDPIPFTEPDRARLLLESAITCSTLKNWGLQLLLLMPGHLHAKLFLPVRKTLANTIGVWNAYRKRSHQVEWHNNSFDHRIRNDRSDAEQLDYIRRNPVAAGRCPNKADWPWRVSQNSDRKFIRGWAG